MLNDERKEEQARVARITQAIRDRELQLRQARMRQWKGRREKSRLWLGVLTLTRSAAWLSGASSHISVITKTVNVTRQHKKIFIQVLIKLFFVKVFLSCFPFIVKINKRKVPNGSKRVHWFHEHFLSVSYQSRLFKSCSTCIFERFFYHVNRWRWNEKQNIF